jgi:glutamate racemase
MRPDIDAILLADTENAPYGTKSREEIIGIVKRNIKRLSDAGADKIVMACCTASTVHHYLTAEERAICLPIVEKTANAAAALTPRGGRIAVLATAHTAASRAFTAAITGARRDLRVSEYPAQSLVALCEGGARDGALSAEQRRELYEILKPLFGAEFDTLILGCTHFDALLCEIGAHFPRAHTVSAALEGARAAAELLPERGAGRISYL